MLANVPDIIPASEMPYTTLTGNAERLRSYFESGATRSYDFRKRQLQRFKQAIIEHEEEILQALFTDLKKNAAEAYATEIGLTLAEINKTLKNLHKWMRPEKVSTNLVNLPSKSYLLRDPLGVVFIIAPWNYPFQLSLLPIAGAIAGGNCVVVKPSELAPASAAVIEEIISKTFSTEYIFVAQGEGSVVVPELMNTFRFDHVFYTGSIPVGKIIYELAAKNLVPVTLELGGKSPCIVESDAALKTAAKRIALGKFTNAGQTCVAPDYVLVHESIKEQFIELLMEAVKQMYGDDPSNSNDYGKIITRRRFDSLIKYLPQGKIIYGGKTDAEKLYISPTLLTDVKLDSPLMNGEIFGPIFPILSYSTFEEARKIVAQNPDPLAFYIFTNSKEKEHQWLQSVSFGGGCVNNTALHFTNDNLPFGGVRNSGIGSYHGKYSFDAFTHTKAVLKTPNWIDPSLKYPPYEGKLKWLKKIFK
jgi:aldehyde dehydrogenase (NAD+)